VSAIRFNTRLGLVLLASFALFAAQQAKAVIINFHNLDDTEMNFGGGTFSFSSNDSGYQFSISSVTDGDGDSIGFQGFVSPGGPFTIGNIATMGSIQTAPVTGTSTLHITDSQSDDLTATVQWNDITTFGVGGIVDLTGAINLTNIAYLGSSDDLFDLADAGSASDVLSFQFVPAMTLTQLKTTGGETSYSGSISTPTPEPATIAILALFAASLATRRRAV
jgi:hypothetical protein